MTFFEFILNTVIMFGSIAGILCGWYLAFYQADSKLKKDTQEFIAYKPTPVEKTQTETYQKIQNKIKETKEKKKQKKAQKAAKVDGKLKTKINKRDAMSYTEFESQLSDKDETEIIEENRQNTDNAYKYK